jgi:5-methylcytosine-specific restriction endonuclease McrA
MYRTPQWRAIRIKRLCADKWCRFCKKLASVVDHIAPHKGNPSLFFNYENTQALCWACHASRKQSAERLGYDATPGADGLPVDPKHPFYRKQGRG